jgi:sarcosine oxidase, subunit beta
MELPRTAEVIIIGGGVMGASLAYHLSQRGLKNVLLLERNPFFGQEATGRCAGGVRYQFATEVNVRLSQVSLPMLERFQEDTGQAIDFRKSGYLFLLTTEDEIRLFRRSLDLQHSLGVNTQWLDGGEVRRRLPLLRLDDVLAATFNEHEGIVDPNGVVMGYIGAAQKAGCRCLGGIEVLDIDVINGRAAGIQTYHGQVSAPVIVNAAGPWAGLVGKMAGLDIPITPLRRQWLTTTPLPALSPDFPFIIDFGRSLYFHRESEGLLTGMSNPHEKPGFDQSVDLEWELVHLEAAIELMPLLEQAGLQSHCAGLYENTPDAHPIYGKTALPGFYVCAGFSGHGFMHGPVSGLLMAEIILDGQSHTVDVSMLDLARFSEGRLIQEYNVV